MSFEALNSAIASPSGAGVASAAGAYLQYRWNRSEAQRARDWNERMSNTQWQRGVADMRAAGINPLVAFGGAPAGFPGGAAAHAPTNPGEAGVSSALNARMNKIEVEKREKESKNLDIEHGILIRERARREYDAWNSAKEYERRLAQVEADKAQAKQQELFWKSDLGAQAIKARELLQYGRDVGTIVRDLAVGASSAAGSFGMFRAGKALRGLLTDPATRRTVQHMLRHR